MLDIGDMIRQKLEIVTQTSESITFDLYSNDVYPSTFTLTSQSYTLADIDQVKGQTIFMGVDGVIEANRVVFEVQNANSYIEYRTNQREFLITALLPLVGSVDSSLPVAITFGDTTYNVYSFLKGTASPLTIGDLMAVSRYNSEVGYLFYSKMIFVETSDIVGFVLSPSNITASQLAEIIDTNGNIVVSLDVSGTKLSLHLSSDTVSKLSRALLTPLSAPSETKLVAVNTTNSQEMVGLGNRLVVDNEELNLSELTEKTLDFAEIERQKSKNLFGILKTYSITRNDITITINSDTQKILINGTASSSGTISFSSDEIAPINVKSGEYFTISKTPNVEVNIGINNKDNSSGAIIYAYKGDKTYTHTITQDSKANRLYFWYSTGETFNNVEFEIQVEKGKVATDYQLYNGAIVHEKEIADVEHIETVYDMLSSDSNMNLGYTTGIVSGGESINIDLSKYKYLIVTHCPFGHGFNRYVIDLDDSLLINNSSININEFMGGAFVPNQEMTENSLDGDLYFSTSVVDVNKQTFTHRLTGWITSSTVAPKNINYHSVIVKIEGVY
jgi:hypothetical protein